MKLFDKINPSIKAAPSIILFSMVLPPLLLVLFRLHTLSLIREMITECEVTIYANFIGIPLGLAGMGLWMFFASKHRSGDLPRWNLLIFFLLQTASLVYFLFSMDVLIPGGVDRWIVPEGPFLMLQLASAMPGLFYGVICMANIRLFRKVWQNIVSSFGVLIVIPSAFYLVAISSVSWRAPEALIVTLCVGGTLVAAFAFIQLLLWLSGRMRHNWIPIVLFAILFPIGGLILNRTLPFPSDLQHWGFYALAVANGFVLLWATLPSSSAKPLCALATAFSYPFTCYFFFLFLPFLPFSLLAMIAAGAGFLILTPAILFILHTRQLIVQFSTLKLKYPVSRLVIGFLIAFLLVPAAYVARAYYHKQIFFKMLDQVYAASFEEPAPLLSSDVAGYALRQLIKTKEGLYVPILSEVYNRIVFGGMVLPDHKLEQLQQLLLVDDTPSFRDTDFSFYSLFTDESRRNSGRFDRPPVRDVSLTGTECSVEVADGIHEATILMTLQNNTDRQAEYVTRITLPDGVFVSGYDLKIEEEMVPARLSDRKAAMWVYHMIRDQARRDPGLVVYTAPNTLQLSVFPLAGNEERQCALKLLYPAGTSPDIMMGNKTVSLPGGDPAVSLITTPAGRQAVSIPAAAARQYPAVLRSVERIVLSGSEATAGYCPEWEVKRMLVSYWASGEKQFESVPQFVTETEQPVVAFDRAAYWLPLIPDGGWTSAVLSDLEVIPFQCGSQVRVVPAEQGGMIVFDAGTSIERYDAKEKKGVPFIADLQVADNSRYAAAIDLWQSWWQTQLRPDQEDALRKELLRDARSINILIPSAAFLAVESTAQQKALEDAEKKSLESHAALAFDEFNETGMNSPEPGLWLMILLVLPVVHWVQRKRVRTEVQ